MQRRSSIFTSSRGGHFALGQHFRLVGASVLDTRHVQVLDTRFQQYKLGPPGYSCLCKKKCQRNDRRLSILLFFFFAELPGPSSSSLAQRHARTSPNRISTSPGSGGSIELRTFHKQAEMFASLHHVENSFPRNTRLVLSENTCRKSVYQALCCDIREGSTRQLL